MQDRVAIGIGIVILLLSCLVLRSENRSRIQDRKFQANEVLPNLYIGGFSEEMKVEQLRALNITHVLTINVGEVPAAPKEFAYMYIMGMDESKQDLLSYFEVAHQFIDEARNNHSSVLVNCMYGESRSGSIVTSYLMSRMQWPLEHALAFAKRARNRIKPKDHFIAQLSAFDKCHADYRHAECIRASKRWRIKAIVHRSWPDRHDGMLIEQPQPRADLHMPLYYRWYLLYIKHPALVFWNYNFKFTFTYITKRSSTHFESAASVKANSNQNQNQNQNQDTSSAEWW